MCVLFFILGFLRRQTYPLLGQLTGTLVLAVAEKFDDTTLIGSEAVGRHTCVSNNSYSIPIFSNMEIGKDRNMGIYKR